MGAMKQSLHEARALKPSRIRQDAQRPVRVVLEAADETERQALCRVLIPDDVMGLERDRASETIVGPGSEAEVRVRGPRMAGAEGVLLDWNDPEPGLQAILQAHPPYRLALGRTFRPLRELLARDMIQAVAARNAAIAALSALPEVIPTPLSLVLAIGEMGSDTVLLTANQIGLAFELAALRGEGVGWRAQAGSVGAIVAGAFGWRTLARELVGLIPAGLGVAAKSGIAYSASLAVGTALWRYGHPAVRRPSLPRAETRTQSADLERQTA